MKPDIIRSDINERLDQLKLIISTAESKSNKLPNSNLRIKAHNNSVYYYKTDDTKHQYGEKISSENAHIAKQLAQRSYLDRVLNHAKKERDILEQFINRYQNRSPEDIYPSLSPQRRALVDPIYLPDAEYIKRWLDVPFDPKGFLETDPYFITVNKERVRSKSEQIIADRLSAAEIPYRYECPVNIGGKLFYPDFTILRMSDRQVIYLEHFGMMDNPDYANNAARKINLYSNNGLIAGKNLFMTLETSRNPLDIRTLDNMIDNLFR